jgi:pseudaminic acid cytidylyltransferase
MKKKQPRPLMVAIIGPGAQPGAGSFYDERWEKWGLNASYRQHFVTQWARMFNLHRYAHLERDCPQYVDWDTGYSRRNPKLPFYVVDNWKGLLKRVAIITARGGSKRLPRKNIHYFHGKPIIHYAIAAARASKLFDEVIVSTDDAQISRVSIDGGSHQVIHRPAELADDHATTAQVMAHAVRYLCDNGAPLEHVCCIYPCTPLLMPADLHRGFDKLVESGKAYAFPVCRAAPAPQRMLRMDDDGRVESVWPQFDGVRTQDIDPRWHDAGQWYWGTADAWMNGVPIYGNAVGVEIPRWRAIDIDTADDWLIAEAVYQARVKG